MTAKKINRVDIRMYRIGTGDCFLLKFWTGQNAAFTMMIDCGSCKGDKDTFNPFIEDIINYTNGHINLLVISHEHSDHIIGFAKSMILFDQIIFDNVWVAWTENPEDEMAKSLMEQYGKDNRALYMAIQKFTEQLKNQSYNQMLNKEYEGKNIRLCMDKYLLGLQNIYSLSSDSDFQSFAATGRSSEMAKAMVFIINKISEKNHQSPFYCYPGKKVPKLQGLEGINIYVLGPPKNESLLKKEEIDDEMYKRKYNINSDFDFVNTLTFGDRKSQSMLPFTQEYVMDKEESKKYKAQKFENENNEWRNIKTDWLHASGALAIRLEKFMNNLSLVLAIEFENSGKVLLFPGDAQIGNWKSWHEDTLKWKKKIDNQTSYITAKELLKNTVFYKVGHHLSHNGTASKSGLDLMEHEELTAFASLDMNNILSVWKNTMPSPGILDELILRTKGRLFTIDDGLMEKNGAKEARNNMTKEEYDNFKTSYEITEKYIQYTILG